jgi:hypothetical protein
VQERTHRRKLVAETDIVEEAGDLSRRSPARHAPQNEIVQVGQLVFADRGANRTPEAFGLLGELHAAARIDHRRPSAGVVRDQHISLAEHVRVDLGVLDRAQVHAGLDPVGEEHRRPAIGRAQHHVGAPHRVRPSVACDHLDAGLAAHLLREGRTPRCVGAVATDARDLAHFDDRGHLRRRLLAAAEHRNLARVRARKIFGGESGGGADPHALDHAVG